MIGSNILNMSGKKRKTVPCDLTNLGFKLFFAENLNVNKCLFTRDSTVPLPSQGSLKRQ